MSTSSCLPKPTKPVRPIRPNLVWQPRKALSVVSGHNGSNYRTIESSKALIVSTTHSDAVEAKVIPLSSPPKNLLASDGSCDGIHHTWRTSSDWVHLGVQDTSQPSKWVMGRYQEFREYLGASYEGYEEEVITMLKAIDAIRSQQPKYNEINLKVAKSGGRGSRELKGLMITVNYNIGSA